jgi:hypothetical protein
MKLTKMIAGIVIFVKSNNDFTNIKVIDFSTSVLIKSTQLGVMNAIDVDICSNVVGVLSQRKVVLITLDDDNREYIELGDCNPNRIMVISPELFYVDTDTGRQVYTRVGDDWEVEAIVACWE